jgi:hypothetical protein
MKKIKQLEQAMYRHARDLEFEEAAKLRDEIQRIRQFGLGLPERCRRSGIQRIRQFGLGLPEVKAS